MVQVWVTENSVISLSKIVCSLGTSSHTSLESSLMEIVHEKAYTSSVLICTALHEFAISCNKGLRCLILTFPQWLTVTSGMCTRCIFLCDCQFCLPFFTAEVSIV